MTHHATTRPETMDREEATRLYLAIARLSRWMRRQGASQRGDLGHGGMSALATLTNAGPMRLGDLANREQVAPPTLSRVVASLESAGYAVRTPDPADRRASIVSATEEGQQIARGLRSLRTEALRNRVERLTPEQHEALVAALPALEALVGDDA
ncbi:MarR family transcriptional regulator [Actinopolymorpha sp. NPDC004070]|uniref:MarR family winged helix-turn-helix transcriptional regulator n=1 Tax=Actinopolymorpha sp. NPDC004070 TaxID=3154548 RepID=UPI0033B9DE99